jgi:hypothetical protein
VLELDELAPGVRFRQLAREYDLWALAEDGALHRVPGGVGDGQLGARAPDRPRLAPVEGAPRFRTLGTTAGGTGTLFAFTEEGEAWGWGSNGDGQLGLGNQETVGAVPVRAAPGRRWSWFGLRSGGACGLTAEGEAFCWGSNDAGQLGNGSTNGSLAPAAVAAPVVPKR